MDVVNNLQYQFQPCQQYILVFNSERIVVDFTVPFTVQLCMWGHADFAGKELSYLPLSTTAKAAIANAMDGIDRDGATKLFEYLSEEKDAIILYEASLSPRLNNEGRINGYLMAARQASENTSIQTRYYDIAEKYNLALKAANFGIYEFDYDNNRYYWDEAMEHMFGCKINNSEEFKNTWLALIKPSSYQGLHTKYVTALKNGTDFHADFSITVHGQTRHIETFATFQYDTLRRRSKKITGIVLDRTAKKNERLALLESEKMYRMLAENMPGVVVLVSPGLKRLYVSPSCQALTGYTVEEFLKGTIKEIIHPEDADAFMDCFKYQVLGGPGKASVNYRIQHKDGHWLYVRSILKAIYAKDRQLLNVISSTSDISSEFEAEKALRLSESRYRMVTDNISDMLILYSAKLERLYVSPSSIRSVGYTPEEMMNQPLFNIIHPDDQSRLRATLLENIKKGLREFTLEFKALHKDGRWLNALCTFVSITNPDGSMGNLLAVIRDVTKERKAQSDLAESEQRYRGLVEASDDIIFIMDSSGRYLFANEVACKKIHQPVERVIGKSIYDFFDGETGDTYVSAVAKILLSQQKYSFENFVTVNMQKIWLRNTGMPLPGTPLHLPAVMFCLTDITDLKTYSATLEMQNTELKKIAFIQSHIVRAPLANIEGLVTLINENLSFNENALYIELLKKSALQLDNIITEIVQRAIDVKRI